MQHNRLSMFDSVLIMSTQTHSFPAGFEFFFFFARVYSSVGAAAGGGGARLSSPGVSSPRGPPEAAAGEPAEGERGGSAEREGEAGGGAGERGAEGGGEPSAPGPPAALFCRH